MRLNERTVITGNLVVLVPYEEHHVSKYHEWMKSEELQTLTGSEPLTLEEEYDMQKLWRTDPDKCTFIVLDKAKYSLFKNETDAMVGDINVFLKFKDDLVVGEISIMIAEVSVRRKGFGKEAVLLMLRYGHQNLNIKIFEVKIGQNNHISISLFKNLGFETVEENKVFNEVTLHRKVTDAWTDWLMSQTENYLKEER